MHSYYHPLPRMNNGPRFLAVPSVSLLGENPIGDALRALTLNRSISDNKIRRIRDLIARWGRSIRIYLDQQDILIKYVLHFFLSKLYGGYTILEC